MSVLLARLGKFSVISLHLSVTPVNVNTLDVSQLDVVSLTRDQTCAPCSGSMEFEPLDYHGSSKLSSF